MSARLMKDLREKVKLSQTEMGALMGLSKNAYIELEKDDPDWKKFKHRHLLTLERLSLMLAVERGDINLALPSVRRDALDLARLITGGQTESLDEAPVVLDAKGKRRAAF
jgi:DNA-binding XRE family transcriptional regulator